MPHYLEDIRSDLSVLHRVDDMEVMPAPRFYALAYRLTAYQSVIATKVRRQKQGQQQSRPKPVEMSLGQWAAAHPAAMREAEEKARAREVGNVVQDR